MINWWDDYFVPPLVVGGYFAFLIAFGLVVLGVIGGASG